MENENLTPEQENTVQNTPSPLHTVTPLSKYLAMALFIALPFLGGWIGYTYAPEKVVEIKVPVEITDNQSVQCDYGDNYYCSAVRAKSYGYNGGGGVEFENTLDKSISDNYFELVDRKTVYLVSSSTSESFYETSGGLSGVGIGTTLPKVNTDGSYLAYVEGNIVYVKDTKGNTVTFLDELQSSEYDYTIIVGINEWNPGGEKLLFAIAKDPRGYGYVAPEPYITSSKYPEQYYLADFRSSRLLTRLPIQNNAQLHGWVTNDTAIFEYNKVLYELNTATETYQPTSKFSNFGERINFFKLLGSGNDVYVYAIGITGNPGTDWKLLVKERGAETEIATVGWTDLNYASVNFEKEHLEIFLNDEEEKSFRYDFQQ